MSTDSKFVFISAKWSEDIGAYVASINGKVAIIDIEPKGAKAVAPKGNRSVIRSPCSADRLSTLLALFSTLQA